MADVGNTGSSSEHRAKFEFMQGRPCTYAQTDASQPVEHNGMHETDCEGGPWLCILRMECGTAGT